jgi:integrase
MREPFFRKSLACWYVKDERGRFIRLDPEKEKAFDKWHNLRAAQSYKGEDATVSGVLVSFLEEIGEELSESRLKTVVYYSDLFRLDHGDDLVSTIKPSTVSRWLKEPKPGRWKKTGDLEEPLKRGDPVTWSASSQRHAAAFIKRAWKWAHDQGHITANLLAGLKLKECEYRDDVLPVDVHQKLVHHCLGLPESKPFALYLMALRSGARPQAIREVTARHVSADCTQWVFKDHKTRKKTGKPLVVFLNGCLQTLTRLLMQANPTGPLFRNAHGDPWKKDTVTQRFERLRTKLDLPEGTVAYLYRHSMATDALLAGQSTAVVSALLGHTDTRMVSKVYGHLDKHSEFLSAAAKAVAESRMPKVEETRPKP